MKIKKKQLLNIGFIILIGLMVYPTTKVYFIRLISFSPSVENVEDQIKIPNVDWKLKGLNTADLNFSNTEGKVVFVNFWATWCPPCIAEMPGLKKLYDDYKDSVSFVFATNEDWSVVSAFFTKKGYDFPVYNSLTNVPEALQSRSIPASYLISRDRKIVVEKKGAANWNSKKMRRVLDRLLKEKSAIN